MYILEEEEDEEEEAIIERTVKGEKNKKVMTRKRKEEVEEVEEYELLKRSRRNFCTPQMFDFFIWTPTLTVKSCEEFLVIYHLAGWHLGSR